MPAGTSGVKKSPEAKAVSSARSGMQSRRLKMVSRFDHYRLSHRSQGGLRRASKRDNSSWYPHFELAVAEATLGAKSEALRELAVAHRLNPRERLVTQVRGL